MPSSKPILLVEDDSVDVMSVERALSKLNVINELVRKVDGQDALEYLQDDVNVKPCIILLDLNMPRMGGLELLEIIKKEDNLKDIPVFVFTTTGIDEHIVKSLEVGATGYISKPVDDIKLLEVMQAVGVLSDIHPIAIVHSCLR